MNQLDTAYLDYLLRLAEMDTNSASNPFTIPQPSITPYDPVHYPTQSTSMLPDVTAFNFVDQMFDFNFDFSLTPTNYDTLPDFRNKPCNQEDMVPKPPVSPEDIDLLLISLDSEPKDFNRNLALPLPELPSSELNNEPVAFFGKPPKQKEVIQKRPRTRRAALNLSYSSYEKRLKTLTEDPFVWEIMENENKVHCLGCKRTIQLDNRRPRSLHLQNWTTHKGRCSGIIKKAQCRQYSLHQ
jgi:hypothetical protein